MFSDRSGLFQPTPLLSSTEENVDINNNLSSGCKELSSSVSSLQKLLMSTHPNETRLLFSRNTVTSGLHCLHALPTLLCLLAKRRKNASREKPEERIRLKKAARPREPCWRQTRRRSRACSTAGWGEIRHGRHRTQRCHFLKQLKPAFTQLSNRCALKQVILWYQTRVRSRNAEIKAMRKQEES